MLRALVALLLLANLLFFGWAQGWFVPTWPPPRHGEREPERLAAQVRPERVTVLSPLAASAAVSAARVAAERCLEAGPFSDASIGLAEEALARATLAPGGWAREPLQLPASWLVFAGRYPEAAALRAREDELRRLSIAFETITTPPELAPGLVLSRHASRAAADAALGALAATPAAARGVRVLALPVPALQLWLRVPHADADQQVLLQALQEPALAGGFKPCALRP